MADSVALVIRTKQVEVVELKGKRLGAKASVPLEGGDPQQLTAAIRSALDLANIKAKKAAVAVEHPDVLFRFFTLPALPKPEWDNAVQFESRRYIPFKPDALAWDYHAVQPKGAPNLEIVFAAMPKGAFDTLRDAVAGAGLQASSIEPRALSLARLLEAQKGAPANEFVCIVDIEAHVAHLSIAKRSMPFMTRDINFVRTVEPAAPADAPAVTIVDAAAPADLSAVGTPLAANDGDPRAQRLLSELSVSMDFFMREYPSTTISKVVLFGDKALVSAWAEWLGSRLTCPVESGEGLLSKKVQAADLELASAVGALQPAGQETIDFLRRRAGASGKPGEAAGAGAIDLKGLNANELNAALQTPQAALCAAAGAAVLLVLWLSCQGMAGGLRGQYQQAVAGRPDVGWALNAMTAADLAPVKEKAEQQIGLLKKVMDRRVSLAAKLDAFARTMPEGMWVNSLTYDGSFDLNGVTTPRLLMSGSCYLAGGAAEIRAIQRFEEDIKKNAALFEGFKHVDVGQIALHETAVGEETYPHRTFQMTLSSEGRM